MTVPGSFHMYCTGCGYRIDLPTTMAWPQLCPACSNACWVSTPPVKTVAYDGYSQADGYSVVEQTSREDVANAVCLLDDVRLLQGAEGRFDADAFDRALHLLRRALTKQAR